MPAWRTSFCGVRGEKSTGNIVAYLERQKYSVRHFALLNIHAQLFVPLTTCGVSYLTADSSAAKKENL